MAGLGRDRRRYRVLSHSRGQRRPDPARDSWGVPQTRTSEPVTHQLPSGVGWELFRSMAHGSLCPCCPLHFESLEFSSGHPIHSTYLRSGATEHLAEVQKHPPSAPNQAPESRAGTGTSSQGPGLTSCHVIVSSYFPEAWFSPADWRQYFPGCYKKQVTPP